jgi:hypothetical protein
MALSAASEVSDVSFRAVHTCLSTVESSLANMLMGDHGFGLLIQFFDAWRPRRNLVIRLELRILIFFAKNHKNVVQNVV